MTLTVAEVSSSITHPPAESILADERSIPARITGKQEVIQR